MNVASLSLCKDLYQRSGWKGTDYFYQFIEYSDLSTGYYLINPVLETPLHANAYPAYDLGFLLRRLPRQAWQKDFYLLVSDSEWVAGYDSKHPTGLPRSAFADTPEDAACKLCVELFKKGILKKSGQ